MDEAWMFMKWPESAKFLETLPRRGRKHNTGLIVASQHIEEFINREEGSAVISSCASRLLLAQSSTIVDQVVDVFHLPSGVREMLQTFAPGEGLLTLNNNTARMQVETLSHEWPHVKTGGE
ncbi:MAG: AAA ATPase [Desulfotomaculum sp. 46_296]|nr:MAG: AAA ATPase [Desulfotomaculum sp. 46_296]